MEFIRKIHLIMGLISRLVFRPGLFHKLKNPSKKNLYILELETPYKKMDVIRFQDKYGRKEKPYEGINFLKKINRNQLIFKKPKKNSKTMYNLQNIKITLKYINNSKQIKNFKKIQQQLYLMVVLQIKRIKK